MQTHTVTRYGNYGVTLTSVFVKHAKYSLEKNEHRNINRVLKNSHNLIGARLGIKP
jgi:hypothetical protein